MGSLIPGGKMMCNINCICFDKDVMSTVVCDNIYPIEKLECSTLLLVSAVHGVPALGDASDLQRLEESLPLRLTEALPTGR